MNFFKLKYERNKPSDLDCALVYCDETGHDVDDPLWVDDDHGAQEVRVKELHGPQIVKELDGLDQLQGM